MADDGRVLRGYLSVLGGDVGRLLVFAAFIPLLVRVVGESNFGAYALVMAVFLPLRKLFNLGLFEASKTYVTRAAGEDRQTLTASSLALHLGTLVVGLPVLFVAITLAPIDATLRGGLYFVLPALAGEQLYNFGRGILHSQGRESVVEPLIPLRSVILAVVGLGLASAGYGVPGVFAGFAAGFLTAGLLATTFALRAVGLPTSPLGSLDRATMGTLVRFGLPSMAMAISIIGLYKVDVLLVGVFQTRADTAHYRGALQVSEFIWVVAVAMEQMMIQTTTRLWEEGAVEAITDHLSQLLKYVLVLTTLLVVGVYTLNDEFLGLYFGQGFTASERPLEILLPGVLCFSIARVIWPVVQAGGHLRGLLAIITGALATNIVLNVLLIPRFGIVGAAIATSISYGLMAALHVWLARRRAVDPLAEIPLVRIAVIALVTLGAITAIDARLGPWLSLAVVPWCGLALFAALAVVTNVVCVDEITEAADSLRGESDSQGESEADGDGERTPT